MQRPLPLLATARARALARRALPLLVAICPLPLSAQAVENAGFEALDVRHPAEVAKWSVGGQGYEGGPDDSVAHTGSRSLRLRRVGDPAQFGLAKQSISATPFRGTLLRLSGYIRTANVRGATPGCGCAWTAPTGRSRSTT